MEKHRIIFDLPMNIYEMLNANKEKRFISATSQYVKTLIVEDSKKLQENGSKEHEIVA